MHAMIRTGVRFGGAAVPALAITFMLFVGMVLLLTSGEMVINDPPIELPPINTTLKDQPVQPPGLDIPDRPIDKTPPPPEFVGPVGPDIGSGPRSFAPPPPPDGEISFVPQRPDASPIVRIEPRYPSNAQARGLEGYVIVRFNVDETGTPFGIEILESTSRLFERATLKAVERWKYAPRIVNGKPVKQFGLEVKIPFILTD